MEGGGELGTLCEDLIIFMIGRFIIPGWRRVSDKRRRENRNTFHVKRTFSRNISEKITRNAAELEKLSIFESNMAQRTFHLKAE